MASDEILNNLFEIAQSEVDEIIYFNDFSTELRNNFKELTNDEYDSALLAINQQVKNGTRLTDSFSGKISFSNSIISKAITTVEYEKQQRENSERIMESRKVNIQDVIITSEVLYKMIDNFENLSQDEKNIIIDNLDYVSIEKMPEVLEKFKDDWDNISKNSNSYEQKENAEWARELTGTFANLYKDINEAIETGNFEKVRKFYEEHKNILDKINENRKKENKPPIKAEYINKRSIEELANNTKTIIQEIEKLFLRRNELKEKGEETSYEENEEISDIDKELNELKVSFPEVYEAVKNKLKNSRQIPADKQASNEENNIEDNLTSDFKKTHEYIEKNNKGQTQDETQVVNNSNESTEKEEGTIEEKISEEYVEEIDKIPSAFFQYGFEPEEIKDALTQYKNYFENLGEDDLQFLSEQTDVELAEILQSEFKEFEVDDRVAQVLDIMSNINYHGKIGEILTSPEKREIFFAELDNAISMDMNVDKSSIVIQDSELAELFERASVDFQVADATQVREEGAQTTEFDSSYIEESDVSTMHLKNSVPMQVDTVFERLCDEALQEGAVLDNDAYEKLLQEYMNEQGLKKFEAKSNAPETKGEKAGEDNEHANSELPPIFENQNNLDETIVDSNVPKDSISEFTEFEEYVDEDGNTKKVAGLKKDEKGDITDVTVFNPLNFVKISGVTTAELQEQVDMVKTLTQERTAVTENKKDEHEGEKE